MHACNYAALCWLQHREQIRFQMLVLLLPFKRTFKGLYRTNRFWEVFCSFVHCDVKLSRLKVHEFNPLCWAKKIQLLVTTKPLHSQSNAKQDKDIQTKRLPFPCPTNLFCPIHFLSSFFHFLLETFTSLLFISHCQCLQHSCSA